MTEAPKRIWLDWPNANRGEPVFDEPPEHPGQAAQTKYVRADIAQEAALQALASDGQAQEAMDKLRAVEAERDALRAEVVRLAEIGDKMADCFSRSYIIPGIAGQWAKARAALTATPAPKTGPDLIEYAERVERLVGLTESERARFGAVLRGWAGQDVTMPAPGSDVAQLVEAAKAGWKAARKTVYGLCESTEERAEMDMKRGKATEHQRGFFSGERMAARSIRKAMGSFEAENDDNFTAALAALEGLE